MRLTGALLTAILSIGLLPDPAAAGDFPDRQIRIIVPFPAGGPNDIIARVVGQRMSEIIRQPVIIDNRSGQAGVLGTDVVAKAKPDGYTVAISSAGALAITSSLEKISYEPLKDLQPITLVAEVPEMLVVATSVPAANMKELIAYAKAHPAAIRHIHELIETAIRVECRRWPRDHVRELHPVVALVANVPGPDR